MAKGRLRVMLGAAPGVGKTFTMLEEGRRLKAEGRDVVVAVVENHGRAATAALLDGLEVIPRRTVDHRGVALDELDVDAVLARQPAVALVDELAHTNAPGSAHAKRWEDVAAMLDAGIDVISTVNIQHIESLNDVVEQITGRPAARDDSGCRAARRRPGRVGRPRPRRAARPALGGRGLPGGTRRRGPEQLLPARQPDGAARARAAVARRRGRHRAAAISRRARHRRAAWEARERIVVALTGGPEGDTLLRRGARIARAPAAGSCSPCTSRRPEGLADPADPTPSPHSARSSSRSAARSTRSSPSRSPTALVEFARGVNATQLVIGVSRRSRLEAFFGGAGTSASVIRLAGDIDVHIVSHAQAGGRTLPRVGGALSLRRRLIGFAITLARPPAAHLGALRVPQRRVDHERRARVPAVRRDRRPGRRHLAGAAGRRGIRSLARLLLRRPAVHGHDRRPAAPAGAGDLRRRRGACVARRRSGRPRGSGGRARHRRSGAARLGRGQRAERSRRARGARHAAARGVRHDERAAAAGRRDRRGGDAIPELADDADDETTIPLGEDADIYLRGRALQPADRRVLGAFVAQLETALVQRRLRARPPTPGRSPRPTGCARRCSPRSATTCGARSPRRRRRCRRCARRRDPRRERSRRTARDRRREPRGPRHVWSPTCSTSAASRPGCSA